jgi:equilibrative nucleoside transporter 1/2/3
MYCNAAPTQRHLPIVFRNDADFILFMIFFAVSNGYLGNLCMIHGPKTSVSSELQETTAMVLVACLVLGTGSGSFLSYPLTKAI